MRKLFDRFIANTPFIAMQKVLAAIDNEHNWGGWARPEAKISDGIINSFFSKYGTTQVKFKKFENLNLTAGYYYIPLEVRRLTVDTDEEERIAVFQRVSLFKGAYKDIVLIKTYGGLPSQGEDMLSLVAKAQFLDGLIRDIQNKGGLPVHQNTKAPTGI